MKAFTISAAVALLAAFAQAAPSPAELNARSSSVTLTFHGADPPSYYVLTVSDNGQVVTITNPLSISYITSSGGGTCEAHGVDGSDTIITSGRVDVGPPQTQISVSCHH